MEAYAWIIILGTWLLLLLLGLAGGDPLAAGRPGQEAPAVAFVRWLQRLMTMTTRARRRADPCAGQRRASEGSLRALV